MSFWRELKRRNVVKVGVAYAIVAWLLIQGADIVSPHLRLPEWTVPLVIILLSIGFPIALILAWAFELTPNGIKLTKEVPHAESITHLTGQKFNYIVTGLLVLAVGFLAVKVFFLDKGVKKIDVVSTETGQVPTVSDVEKIKKTIAVLPFENLSSDPEQVYFVDGLSEEILNSLAQISDLNVIGRTSSFSFKGSNKKVQEIANELGADNILEGSVRKAGNALRITAQLLRGTDGVHLWSETYDRELKDIFAVQENIATAVADELKTTLGIGKSIKQLGGTDNPEAYELYLTAKGSQYFGGDISQPIELIDRAIALDPEYALAWAYKAVIYSVYVTSEPDKGRLSSLLDKGLNAAQRSIELEPNLAAGYVSLGLYKTFRSDWIEAELFYRKAFDLSTEPFSVVVPQITTHYMAVGYLSRAKELFEEIRQNDPLNFPNRGWYINCLGLLGDVQGAEEENERCRAFFGDFWGGWLEPVLLGTRDVIYRDEIVVSDSIWDVAKEHLESPEDGLAELRRLYINEEDLTSGQLRVISMWTAYFGDPEFAMDAIEKAHSLDPPLVHTLWFPKMRKVRQLPRFKEYVKKIGLVDYWNKFGWPDICHKLDNGDFECD